MQKQNSSDLDQAKKLLGTASGQTLLRLLSADGGVVLRQAAERFRAGDTAGAQALLEPLLQSDQAREALESLQRHG